MTEKVIVVQWFPEITDLTVDRWVPFQRRRVHKISEPLPTSVSQELRVPLTSIKGFVDTLLRSRDKLTEEQQIHFLGIIKDQTDSLTKLVEDL